MEKKLNEKEMNTLKEQLKSSSPEKDSDLEKQEDEEDEDDSSFKTDEKIVDEDAIFGTPSKNFRNSHDIENFYRFVHENELRREAKIIFDSVLDYMQKKKKHSPRKGVK